MTPGNVVEKWKKWSERRAIRKFQQNLEKKAQKPRLPMPPIRSSLTLPLGPRTNAEQQAGTYSRQEASLLFSRLTSDTRWLIYREVLGDRCFHILRKCARLAFLFCRAKDAIGHTQSGCWGYQNLDGTFDTRYWSGRIPENERPWYAGDERVMCTADGGLLPVLLTCRLM
jgi:hypothetical protein